jgi:sulfatase modifying factor 1
MAVGCASNPPEFKNRVSKKKSPHKKSMAGPHRKRQAPPRASIKSYRENAQPSASRSPNQKIRLPTLAHEQDNSLMILVDSKTSPVSVLNQSRGILRPDESVTASKNIPPFYMDRLEITVAQYRNFENTYDEKLFAEGKECPKCPAMGIDWNSAHRYCLWAGKRLPTEAEWMLAAGGKAGPSWPWGKQFSPNKANLWGDEDGSLAVSPVGAYPQGASPSGLMDMVGNVWEWVSDPYFVASNKSNQATLRIVKGGGWTSAEPEARISFRNIVDAKIKNPTIGFRCVKPVTRENNLERLGKN